MTRKAWLSYSCLRDETDHARCRSGPDQPSPQGIAPVCTCMHHTQPNWWGAVDEEKQRLENTLVYGLCWCGEPRRVEEIISGTSVDDTIITTLVLICYDGHRAG